MALPLRLALFDCDGTLVDSQHAIVAAMTSAWLADGLDAPEPAAVRRVVGLSLVEAVARLLPEAGPERHQRLADLYREAFLAGRKRGQSEPLFPEIREALAALATAGMILGIATGKSRRGLDAVLEHHDLAGCFATLQTADTAPGKPHPAMVHQALAATGARAADTVVIGDTTFDIEMAHNAGVRAIGVTWGYHEATALVAARADRLADRASQLPIAIVGLLPERDPGLPERDPGW